MSLALLSLLGSWKQDSLSKECSGQRRADLESSWKHAQELDTDAEADQRRHCAVLDSRSELHPEQHIRQQLCHPMKFCKEDVS